MAKAGLDKEALTTSSCPYKKECNLHYGITGKEQEKKCSWENADKVESCADYERREHGSAKNNDGDQK